MRISRNFSVLAACLAVVLGGCSANWNTAYRTSSVSENQTSITLVDAKQRAILTAQRPVVKKDANGVATNETFRAFCTEPSPDVFSVMSMALGGGANFGQNKEAKTLEAALQFALSSNEIGATISRTQTINMLREMMYRTCERYLSGGLDASQLPIQAIRDQRLMVSILAIEQLTGVTTIKPTIIAANGDVTVGQNSSAGIEALAAAQKKRDKTRADFAEAEKTYDAKSKDLNPKDKTCPELEEKASKLDKGEKLVGEEATKLGECTAAKDALAAAEETQKTALADYKVLESQAGAGGTPVAASTTAQLLQGGGDIMTVDRSAAISTVAAVVKEIVLKAYDQDEFLLMCVRELPGSGTAAVGSVHDACLKYITESINLQTAEKKLEADIILQRAKENYVPKQEKIVSLMNCVTDASGKIDQKKLAVILDSVKEAVSANDTTRDIIMQNKDKMKKFTTRLELVNYLTAVDALVPILDQYSKSVCGAT